MKRSLGFLTLASLVPVVTVAVLAVERPGDTGRLAERSDAAFEALHFTFGRHSHSRTVALGEFTPGGPLPASLKPVSKDLRQAVSDLRGGYYALTRHDVGHWSESSGKFQEIRVEGVEDISWPKGIAFASRDRCLWISSATGAGGFLHAYDVDRQLWRRLELGQTRLGALAYDAKSARLFGVVENPGKSLVSEVAEFNAHGAVIQNLELAEPIFVRGDPFVSVQLKVRDGDGYLLVSDPKPHSRLSQHRLYRLDLRSGTTELLPYAQDPGRLERLWPGMPEGASTFDDTLECCASGAPSNYVTPSNLLAEQAEELHVISVGGGDFNALQEILRRVKRVEVDGTGKVGLTLDLSTKTAPVDVRVHGSEKPVVACVAACNAVTWRFRLDSGARLKKVIVLGHGEQTVLGLPAGVEVEDRAEGDAFTSRFSCAPAWEVEHNTHEQFDKLIRRVRKLAGLREASFQGCSLGRKFEVPLE